MANIVRVSTTEANSANQKLRGNLEESNRKLDRLNNISKETGAWWVGETGTAFRASFDAGIAVFKQYLDKLQQHGMAMVKSVEKQHQHDQNLAKNIRRY